MTERSSNEIVVESPMSFAGSGKRMANWWRSVDNPWVRWLAIALPLALLAISWWGLIVTWYGVFGILLVPFRLIRRSSRRQKLESARHAETLRALNQS